MEVERRAQAARDRRASQAAIPEAAFSGFAERWLRVAIKPNRKPSTHRRYESICRVHLVPYFEDREILGITEMDIEEFKADQMEAVHPDTGEPISNKTINNNLSCLSSMFERAVRWGYLHTNPCEGVEPLPLDPADFTFYDKSQTDAFLDACLEDEPALYPLVLSGFRSGLRLGELIALHRTDLNFTAGNLVVRRSRTRGHTTLPKSGKIRTVDMPESLKRVLQAHLATHDGMLVFCRPDGSHFTRDMLKHPFERIWKKAGLPRITPHDMRHSYASQLVMDGVNLRAVQELLGHSDIRTTERYAHLAPGIKASMVARLDDGSTHGNATPGLRLVNAGNGDGE